MTKPAPFHDPARYLFFTGKGGVGKTSLSCTVALSLADSGKRVLLVSTDPASNLDEMLGVALSDRPKPVPGAAGLLAMNIDPDKAAEEYRARVINQMGEGATEEERATVREQLSGACTIEIAAFDEFVGLLAGEAEGVDHVIFDTAPTGHTLRLLSLPRAWTGFLKGNDRGASCLGPHSGLKMQEERFKAALATLSDPARTAIVLVTRADRGAVREAPRTTKSPAEELGLTAPEVTEEQLLDAMVAHPVLVNRPIVCTPREVRRCRPSETMLYLIDRIPSGPLAKDDGSPLIDGEGKRVA